MRIAWLGTGMLWMVAACSAGVSHGGDGGQIRVGPSPCDALLNRVCGEGGADAGACSQTADCEAAQFIKQYRPEDCPARYQDTANYQTCGGTTPLLGDACSELEEKCCGNPDGGVSCQTAAACLDARDLRSRADLDACRQARADDTAFPRCTPR